jgi:uroporphyrinogen decarboxylase
MTTIANSDCATKTEKKRSSAGANAGAKSPLSPLAGSKTTAEAAMTNRDRFLRACCCAPLDYPPVWLMRQAGRALPEYRALKGKYSFLELVQTPELAAEVTLQPIRRFDFDAAILFSDILIAAEGLGQSYRFREKGGIEMDFLLKSLADVERLEVEAVGERLQYVSRALQLIKPQLNGRTALIGFAGSPWTLANFMLEGAGVKEYSKARELAYSDPRLFEQLMEKLAKAVSTLLQLQIAAGVDAVQIFDSLGGLLSEANFKACSGGWIKQIIQSLAGNVPVILFAKGVHGNWDDLQSTGAQVLGIDSNVRLAHIRSALSQTVAVQGNLDPFLLTTNPETVAAESTRILTEMRGKRGHIFNLGHGVPPNARLENVEALMTAVRGFK